jgi:hypothetical protein
MRPGDHPEFFRLPPPEGRSRESSIRIDGEGRFWHDGRRVEHPGVASGLHAWIGRHPDDRRYILTNGYDWTYFIVDDVPFFVRALRVERDKAVLQLSDGSEEAWTPEDSRVGADGAVYTTVKRDALGGPYEAKFSRHAQASLGELLVEAPAPASRASRGSGPSGNDDGGGEGLPVVRIGGAIHAIGAKKTGFG